MTDEQQTQPTQQQDEERRSSDAPKAAYFVSNTYAMIGGGANPVAPGERVPYDETNESHKYLRARVEAGDPDYEHLQFLEVDLRAEREQESEREEMAEKARHAAAEAREQIAEEERSRSGPGEPLEDQPPATEGTVFPPQDEEAIRISKEAGAGQRATTDADVVEDKPRSRRASSRSTPNEE